MKARPYIINEAFGNIDDFIYDVYRGQYVGISMCNKGERKKRKSQNQQ